MLFQRCPFFWRRDFCRQRFKARTRRRSCIQASIHRLLHRVGVVAHCFFGFCGDAGKDFVKVNADVGKSILRRLRRLFLRLFGFLRGFGGGLCLPLLLGNSGICGLFGKDADLVVVSGKDTGCFVYGVRGCLRDLRKGGARLFSGILRRARNGFAAGTDGFARIVDDVKQRTARVVGNFVQAGKALQHAVRGTVGDAEKVAHRLSCAKDAERDVGGNLHDGGEDDTNSRKARLQPVQPDGERLECPVERYTGCL